MTAPTLTPEEERAALAVAAEYENGAPEDADKAELADYCQFLARLALTLDAERVALRALLARTEKLLTACQLPARPTARRHPKGPAMTVIITTAVLWLAVVVVYLRLPRCVLCGTRTLPVGPVSPVCTQCLNRGPR